MQVKDGVVLQWKGGGSDPVQVIRTTSAPAARQRAPREGNRTQANTVERLEGGATRSEVGSSAEGTVGMLDVEARAGAEYIYQAERVRVARLGGQSITVRSEPTLPLQIAMRDTFPPLAPTGLVTVPGTGDGTDTRKGPSIDLSWQPNAETDLVGYLVYRTDLGPRTPGTTPRRLTPKPVPGPAYRDTEVVAAERYEYRVTAIDRVGNESHASAPQVDSAPASF